MEESFGKAGVRYTRKQMRLNRKEEDPYKVEQDLEKLKEQCSLCQDLPCCPEHCCDWDSCACGDCENCASVKPQEGENTLRRVMDKSTWEETFEKTNEPEILIKPTGEEEVSVLNRPTSKVLINKSEIAKEKDRLEAEFTIDDVPQEVKQTVEEFSIHNFEVNIKEEKQVAYASGVRGIRALKLQRDMLQNKETFDQEIMNSTSQRDKFFNASQRAEANKQMRMEKQQHQVEGDNFERDSSKTVKQNLNMEQEMTDTTKKAEPPVKRTPRIQLKKKSSSKIGQDQPSLKVAQTDSDEEEKKMP